MGALAGAAAVVAAPIAIAAGGEVLAGIGVAASRATVLAVGLEAQYAAGSLSTAVHGAALVGLTGPTDYDAVILAEQRAQALQDALPEGSRGRVTMAAGVVEDAAGVRQTIIGTSEKRGYLRPGVKLALRPGEIVAGGSGHGEQNLVEWSEHNGHRVVAIGAGRPICSSCGQCIDDSGGILATPLKDR